MLPAALKVGLVPADSFGVRPEDIVLGIDLGTSFSSASAWIDGRLHYALDPRGEASIPSVVYIPRTGAPLVGAEADRMRLLDPQNTIHGVKRLLGAAPDSPAARLAEATSAVRLAKQPDGSVGLRVRARDFRPAEVASYILRYLRERAELRFGRGIKKAMLTHPVNASKAAIEATILAAKIAQLEVVGTVSEPSAGAVAAGLGPETSLERFLMFDFGGGTLDVTVMEHKTPHEFKVLSADGDDLLGGDDFDHALARRINDVIWRARNVELTRDIVVWERVNHQCELTKRALSSRPESRIKVPEVVFGQGDLELRVTREDAEPCWRPLVDRAIHKAAETMVAAGLKPKDLGALVPIGGTTNVPLVRESLQRVFPLPFVKVRDPQTVVAAGAALVGANAAQVS